MDTKDFVDAIEAGAAPPRAHGHVCPELQLVANIAEISSQLTAAGEPFAPGPVLPQLGQREFVDRNVRIDPGTGITVPVPDPAWLRGGVDQLCAKQIGRAHV